MTPAGAIWFHAVSVGEVLAAAEIIRHLRAERAYGKAYLSTSTLAGHATAVQRLGADAVFFAPLDYRSAVRRVIRKLRPAALVVLETEIWPNLYREAKRAGAALLVVNGRISDRKLPQYRRWHFFFRHVLCWPDLIYAQTEEDARRYRIAGAPEENVRVGGNLKFDFTPPTAGIPPEVARFLDRLQPEQIWIAASTMPPAEPGDPDEDDAVIEAFAELARSRPGLLLILAPRRPERFDSAAGKLEKAGIRFVRRTALGAAALPCALLLDSIGELAALFERASVVFMGGTLASRGGHNILEPAYFAKPVVAGPHMENFAAIAQEFTAAGALVRIEAAKELAGAVEGLLAGASPIGAKARELALAQRGAVARISAAIVGAAAQSVLHFPRGLAARLLLTPLAWVWRAGHRINLARALAQRKKLAAKVVSVGGLSMGGAGKSPLVEHLAERVHALGRQPAILTRGYRKKSSERMVIVPRGERAAIELTGDEAQMFVRAAHAHVGIGADRYAVGREMERTLHPDLFLLDDGFQHARLHRDEDIVLMDALDPLAGGPFPLGRRREPLESLVRATAVIVTRLDPGQDIAGIERLIRRYNSNAPIFRSRVVPRAWIDFEDGLGVPLTPIPFGPVAAFCGLGSPQAFWHSLEELGMEVAFRWAFGDHHAYRPSDLRRLAVQASRSGARALVTTGKDIMNLCQGAAQLLQPHKLFWLKIGIQIEDEEALLKRIL